MGIQNQTMEETPLGGGSKIEATEQPAPGEEVVKKKKFQPKAVSPEEALLKDIKIKTGVCKRLVKELLAYKKENLKLQEKVDKLAADGACEHDVKKQKEVLDENSNIIPSCITRLQEAYENLYALMDEHEDNSKIQDSEEVKIAKEVIAS